MQASGSVRKASLMLLSFCGYVQQQGGEQGEC